MPPRKKFVPRQRKHKVRERLAREARDNAGDLADIDTNAMPTAGAGAGADSNVAEILPEEVRARNEKKAQLRAELRAGQASQMSSKKAKRLEKYIETKLRKDESRDLNEKLAAAAEAMDPAAFAAFQSSRDIGKGKKRRRAEQARQQQAKKDEEDDDDEDDDDEEEEEDDRMAVDRKGITHDKTAYKAKGVENLTQSMANVKMPAAGGGSSLFAGQAATAGSGLKRPLDLNDDGRPILAKRKKRGGVKSKFDIETVREAPVTVTIQKHVEGSDASEADDDSDAESGEWNGFSDGEDASNEDRREGEDGEEDEEEDGEEEDGDEDEEDEDEDDEDEDEGSDSDVSPRPSGFKAWAQQRRNEALGFRGASDGDGRSTALAFPKVANFVPRAAESEPLPASLQPTTRLDRKAFHVEVARSPEIESARLALPVVAEEQQIVEAIHEHDVVIVSGGTGSGKTTQVPQFLFEAGYGNVDSDTPGMIGVTQPRRVAAVSMARRVAEELGPVHGGAVAYQIRFESTMSARTAIKFMTDGVLLREAGADVALRQYSAVVIDEAHERSINTDVLIGIVSCVNRIRADLNSVHVRTDGWYYEKVYDDDPANIDEFGNNTKPPTLVRRKPFVPLKLIIMSATLQLDELTHNTRLFRTPPRVVVVEGRQYPVTVHFARTTRHDYADEAFSKVVRGHRKLPPGGFLVFLTGEDEIQRLARRLRLEINGVHSASQPKVRLSTREVPAETEDIEFGGGLEDEEGGDGAFLEGEDLDEPEADEDDVDDALFVPDEGETAGSGPQRVHVLPLFSKLPTKEQQRVFAAVPAGHRLVVLATNVAETSLTIPGIRYVFDSGRAKARTYNRYSGVQTFEVGWVSKASASQRAGRAGRTGPGHCYRLYSSAVYEEQFDAFAEPEILRMPIEGVVLQLKAMHVPYIESFPFPTPPDVGSLRRAERLLRCLGAVHETDPGVIGSPTEATPLGELMAAFPLSPRFAKILMVGHPGDCIHYVIALVAALSADEIFVRHTTAIPPVAAATQAMNDELAARAARKAGTAGNGRDAPYDDADDDAHGPPARLVRTPADIRQDELHRTTAELYWRVQRQFASLDGGRSDALKMLQAVGEFSHEPTEAWCAGHFLHHKALLQVQKMRRQLTHLLRTSLPLHASLAYQEQLPRPTPAQITLLKQMVAAGFVDNLAMRADLTPVPPRYGFGPGTVRRPRRAIEVPYRTLQPLMMRQGGAGVDDDAAPRVPIENEFVFLHSTSPMAHLTPDECPPFVVYANLQRNPPTPAEEAAGVTPKVRMRSLTDVTGLQLAGLLAGTPLLSYGKPLKETSRSPDGREREAWVVPEVRAIATAGSMAWPLPAVKVRQRKVPGLGWEVVTK